MYEGSATIVLRARDVAGSAEFYQRVLGFTLEGWWRPARCALTVDAPETLVDSWAELSAGPTRLRLRPAVDGESPGSAEVALAVRDLDVLYRRVREALASIPAPAAGLDGRRRFAVDDPDGHRWSLVQAD